MTTLWHVPVCANCFSERPALQVVGEAANGVEAISQAMALQPDVIVMDVSMPQMNGIEATREIHRSPATHPDRGAFNPR